MMGMVVLGLTYIGAAGLVWWDRRKPKLTAGNGGI